MSKVEQIEAALRSLSPADLKRVRDWLDVFVEDRLEFRKDAQALELENGPTLWRSTHSSV